ncbi:hypothetical protein [Streptomyces sp. NBC_01803]|uniref:hypothetical protein n=1 Tax=Streptomyces sp. NBC_01803 TaxID=2975946 RepID=UPI002DD992F7|nr:hypothetical protein [Streptomyces sp. NBC_01803]WSA47398.1 hypothetical protein OIE51_26435 [Streptomyces sp. NBC_01803]
MSARSIADQAAVEAAASRTGSLVVRASRSMARVMAERLAWRMARSSAVSVRPSRSAAISSQYSWR